MTPRSLFLTPQGFPIFLTAYGTFLLGCDVLDVMRLKCNSSCPKPLSSLDFPFFHNALCILTVAQDQVFHSSDFFSPYCDHIPLIANSCSFLEIFVLHVSYRVAATLRSILLIPHLYYSFQSSCPLTPKCFSYLKILSA